LFDAGRVFRLTARVLILLAVLLGVIEGLTEFLPISSTGHLIIAGHWLAFEEALGGKARSDAFLIFIQSGAILAVVFYFRERLWQRVREAAGGGGARRAGSVERARRFLAGICVATVPAVVVGLLANRFLDALPSEKFVAWVLIAGGAALWAVDQWRPKPKFAEAEDFGWGVILVVGVAQTLAMLFPGLSRSGATIMAALLLGAGNKAAAEFSFFLSIPTMCLACSYKLAKAVWRGDVAMDDGMMWAVFGVGFAVSFVSAALVVKAFLAFLRKHGFKLFAYYRVVLGAVVLGAGRFF